MPKKHPKNAKSKKAKAVFSALRFVPCPAFCNAFFSAFCNVFCPAKSARTAFKSTFSHSFCPAKSAFRPAFSVIELVFVIALFGILVVAIPSSLHLRQKSCYAELASLLANLQERFSLLYTSFTLSPKPLSVMRESSLALLQNGDFIDLGGTKNCALSFSKNRLIARAWGEMTEFSIVPNDFSEQPAFKCNFTTNALCRKILERTKIR